MAVIMIGVVPGMSEDDYAGMVQQLKPTMQAFKGFISHVGGPNAGGGWGVVEVWESEDDANAWYDQNVKPNLPPGAVPDRTIEALHTAFTK